MIFTQNLVELGLPQSWQPIGAWAELVDGPTGPSGYGTGGYAAVIEKATKMLVERFGATVRLVNANFESRPGNAHPSYERLALFITGDLYRVQQEDVVVVTVPTYYDLTLEEYSKRSTEFAEPRVPVAVRAGDGLRIVLGDTSISASGKPDVLIERRVSGWAVYLSLDGGDPTGILYALDDGRSFFQPESNSGLKILPENGTCEGIDD